MEKQYNEDDMRQLARKVAQELRGGEVIELVGDVGAGKTTFTKALAANLGVEDVVQSPTFTISNRYDASNNLILVHYDFYRLSDPGIMRDELTETVQDPQTITVLEWSEIVADVLPTDHLTIELVPVTDTTRKVIFTAGGAKSKAILEKLQ